MALITDLLGMVSEGTLNPVQPSTYPLEEVVVALEHRLARRMAGKVALIP
jgi:NADPH:quinone reductase-like Zn-dependent oxidoreductase